MSGLRFLFHLTCPPRPPLFSWNANTRRSLIKDATVFEIPENSGALQISRAR